MISTVKFGAGNGENPFYRFNKISVILDLNIFRPGIFSYIFPVRCSQRLFMSVVILEFSLEHFNY
jgi:hypothetical protein